MKIRCGIIAIILGLMTLAARAQEEVKVTGRVVDADGKPVAGAEVAAIWNAEKEKMTPYKGAVSDNAGRFTQTLTFYGPGTQGLLALDKDRKRGGLLLVENQAAKKPVEIKLVPLVHVHGKFFCKELNKRPTWTNVYVMSGRTRFLSCSSTEAKFSFDLPPGTYQFWGYGTDIQNVKKDITLQADKPDLDMGTLDVPATVIARHKGKAPPPWHVTDARGVQKDVKIADFKGKWVLVEFWGFW
jgi:hypothetical protein